jgi:hypothetical protein
LKEEGEMTANKEQLLQKMQSQQSYQIAKRMRLDWERSEYAKLVGRTVSKVVRHDPFFGLEFSDGTVAWIQCDEEGNDGGFLRILTPKGAQ